MSPGPQPPEWLVPGAEVVTWSLSPRSGYGIKRGKVNRVAGSSFTLEDGREPRYKIATMNAMVGVDWSRVERRVAPVDSPEGVYWTTVGDVEDHLLRADSAIQTFQRERTRHSAVDLQSALALWIASSQYLDTLTEPRRP